jgi:hypothetical protein
MASPRDMALRARAASRQLVALSTSERVAMLERVAEALLANEDRILAANKLDIEQSEARARPRAPAMPPIDGQCLLSLDASAPRRAARARAHARALCTRPPLAPPPPTLARSPPQVPSRARSRTRCCSASS